MGRVKSVVKLYETFECDACGKRVDMDASKESPHLMASLVDPREIEAKMLYELTEKQGWKQMTIGLRETILCPDCVTNGIVHLVVDCFPAVMLNEERYQAYKAGVPLKDILA